MDIVIIAQYLLDLEHPENSNSRFVYIAKMLAGEHSVEIITTEFCHNTKNYISKIQNIDNIIITALHESGYRKNICLKRFISHRELASNIQKYLGKRKKPDVIYVAVPSLAVGTVVVDYCKKKHVRLIVDIQDLWPEAFKMVFHMPIVSDFVFAPMVRQANKIYSAADEIIAVSQTYAKRGMKVNSKCQEPQIVYLGNDKNAFDSYAEVKRKSDVISIAYVGSLGSSYDIGSVIEAMKLVQEQQLLSRKIQLIVMGSGEYQCKFEHQAKTAGIVATFLGNLPYPQMIKRLSTCDIAVNPIRKYSAGSIVNKVGDYAMAGLPVINTQECKEYRDILEAYGSGINCACGDVNCIAAAIRLLVENENLRMNMAHNSRQLGIEKFDRAATYPQIACSILNQ